ncbi:Cyanate hydratase [Hypsibius exemplaris]|uniref:Cyanate hydratase n=1 Tax=Hypsibius exemplaris TaxID=2072580 RepID=A0A1W0XBM4_HYPEX|nr:Cyanate hydratase [Hypsibius exemplaris]
MPLVVSCLLVGFTITTVNMLIFPGVSAGIDCGIAGQCPNILSDSTKKYCCRTEGVAIGYCCDANDYAKFPFDGPTKDFNPQSNSVGGGESPSAVTNKSNESKIPLEIVQSQYRQGPRQVLTDTIIEAKLRKNLTFEQIAQGTGLSLVYVTSALLGQHPLPAKAAKIVGQQLGLSKQDCKLLQTIPQRRAGGGPSDPTIARFSEMIHLYERTLKVLVHEQFGDGVVSAVNFKINLTKVPDPEGGHRAIITLDGKFQPFKPFK